jgi:PKD repeat protein
MKEYATRQRPSIPYYLFFGLFISISFKMLPISAIAQTSFSGFHPENGDLYHHSFSFSPTSPEIGQVVQFIGAPAEGPTSWLWHFGDGMMSAARNPSHSYAAAGLYTVTLITSTFPGSRSESRTLAVTPPVSPIATLAASFTFSPSSPAPGETVQFTDDSSGIPTSWLWNFADEAASRIQNPEYTFTAEGTYQVILTVANDRESSSTSRAISVGLDKAITAASPSFADVSAAISKAAPGDTVMIPSGSATWTQGLVITKSVKVIGAGVGKTIITRNFAGDFLTYLIKYAPDAKARAADAFFRWSGCTFIFTGQSGSCFDLFNRPAQTPMTKNRIDHCEFVGVDMNARVLQVDGMIWGVFDNNRITSGTLEVYGSNEVSWTYFTATPGGADNFFFEDNVIAYTGINYGFGSGVGGRYCARHNTIDATRITDYAVQLADIHGSMYTGGNLSSMICEIYDNTILANGKGVILGDLRGGQGFIYNNTVYSDQSAFGPSIREELMDTICPPANNVIDGSPQHVHDSYVFNNYRNENGILERLSWAPNGTVDYAAGQTDTSNGRYYPPAEPYRVVPLENLDFWVEAPSFTGASGIGVGLLSARPATGAKAGVGYWATDAKTLYRWTAAGGWQAYYKPYTYPHPLRALQ